MGRIELDSKTFEINRKKVKETEKGLDFEVDQNFESRNSLTIQHLIQAIEVVNRDVKEFKAQTKEIDSSLAKIQQMFVEADNFVSNHVLSQ